MNILSARYTSFFGQLFIASLLLVVFSGNTCKNSDTAAVVCGSAGSVSLSKTLTVNDPKFNLNTPAAFSGESCQAHFSFVFSWADPARAYSTGGSQSIPIDVFSAFSVLSSDGKVGGLFTGGANLSGDAWEVHQPSSLAMYEIVFNDHNAATSLSSVFSINTKLTSTNPGDSVKITASIVYYPPN